MAIPDHRPQVYVQGWAFRAFNVDLTGITNSNIPCSQGEQVVVKIMLESASHASSLLCDLLRVAACSARLEGDYLTCLSDNQRSTVYLLRQALDTVLSSELLITVQVRASISTRILQICRVLGFLERNSTNSLATIPTILMMLRLKDGPETDWKSVDDSLFVLFSSEGWKLEPANISLTVLEKVLGRDWGHDRPALVV